MGLADVRAVGGAEGSAEQRTVLCGRLEARHDAGKLDTRDQKTPQGHHDPFYLRDDTLYGVDEALGEVLQRGQVSNGFNEGI